MAVKTYILDVQPAETGFFQVHSLTECHKLPEASRRQMLGLYQNGLEALLDAKSKFPGYKIDGCHDCIPESKSTIE